MREFKVGDKVTPVEDYPNVGLVFKKEYTVSEINVGISKGLIHIKELGTPFVTERFTIATKSKTSAL